MCADVLSTVHSMGCWQERLAASNRQLKQWHRLLAGKVAGLMSTDLVRHKDKCVATWQGHAAVQCTVLLWSMLAAGEMP